MAVSKGGAVGFWVGLAARLALLLALVLLAARPWVLERLLAVAVRFTSDGVVDADARDWLDASLALLGMLLAAGALLLWLWRWAYRAWPARLPPATEPEPPVARWPLAWPVVAAAMLVLLVLAVRVLDRGLSYDEIFTAQRFVLPGTLWTALSRYELFNNHVASSLLMRGSVALFGEGEWALRLPALLLGLASLPAAFLALRRVAGERAAALAVLLLGCSPALVTWATSARGYTGLLLASLVSSRLLFDLVEAPTRRRALAFALVGALGAWFHLYGVLVLAAQGLSVAWLAWRRSLGVEAFRGAWGALLGAAGLVLLLHVPVLPQLLLHLVARPPGTFQPGFPLEMADELLAGLAILALLVPLGALTHVLERRSRGSYLLALLAVPLLAAWLAAPYDLYPRFFLFTLPWLLLLAAEFLVAALRDNLRSARPLVLVRRAAAGLLLLGVLAASALRSWTAVPEEGYRQAAEAVRAGRRDDTALFAIGGGAELISFYLDEPLLVPETREAFEALIGSAGSAGVVYRSTPWEDREHTAIAEALRARPDVREVPCGNLSVFWIEG